MYKVFYLDDEKAELIRPIVDKLQSTGRLQVDWEKPVSFEMELDALEQKLKSCDALFLDLQLNGDQEDGSKVRYQAPPLAQMVRTLATERKIKDVPIFLCSTDDRIRDSFSRDFTSHDLFDWTFLKNEINHMTIDKICSIIDGYQKINDLQKDFTKLLERDYHTVDDRILSRFINEDCPPSHEIARVIFKDLIQPTGVLIHEDILAARLGIDIEKSADWLILRDELFADARYKGIFGGSWARWWSDTVNDIFAARTNGHLASLDAAERVELLIAIVSNNLVPATQLKFNSSTNFWTVCVATNKPLDPFEGFKIDSKSEPKAWQDYSYVSFYALIERFAQKRGILLHPSEIERFKSEEAQLNNEY